MSHKNPVKLIISDRLVDKVASTNPLVHLTYQQLQAEAIKLNLPANIKYKLLLGLVVARSVQREDVVEAILDEVKHSTSSGSVGDFSTSEASSQEAADPIYQELQNCVFDALTAGGFDNSSSNDSVWDYSC